MCCEAAAHLQAPVESKQEEQMFRHWQSAVTVNKSINAAGPLLHEWTHNEI